MTCAFDPPAVVPGAAGARSMLTISTVASSAGAAARAAASRGSGPGTQTIGPVPAGSGIAIVPSALTFGAQTVSTTSPLQFVLP